MKLVYLLVIVLVVFVIWMGCNNKKNNFSAAAGRTHVEDTFLPIVMSNLGASSEQFGAAAKMINHYDQVCGKVSAAAEIQKILNTNGPSGNWTGLVSQLNQDLFSAKQSTNNCQGTMNPSCNTTSDCAYGSINPVLVHGLEGELIPIGECVSNKCQIHRG